MFEELELSGSSVMSRATNSMTLDVRGVKLDLLRHAYPVLSPNEVHDGITLVSLPDLAAMKLNAIANRGSKKDFYDLVELLEHFGIREMIGFFAGKYQASDPFTVIRSLAWFEDAEMEPDPIPLVSRNWEEVKSIMRKTVAGL